MRRRGGQVAGETVERGLAAARRAPLYVGLAIVLSFPADGLAAERDRPPYPHGDYEDDCAMCHRPDRWSPAEISDRFDHARSGFPLDGAHGSAACRSCHATLEFDEASKACVSCHLDVHRGELGADCARCHTTSSFIDRGDEVRAHQVTRFPLTGAHSAVDCAACHPSTAQGELRFVNTPIECVACHRADYEQAREPDHVASGFGQDCASCHSVVSWKGGTSFGGDFDHASTGFPLQGAHRSASCTACHAGNRYAGTPRDCASCHQQDYQAASAPNHVALALPLDCQQCHTSNAWSPASFDHAATGFALTGSHGALDCQSCHGGAPAAISSDCASCHRDDWQQAPSHAASDFPLTCEECHTTTVWSDARFRHDFFPLSGGHASVTCTECHTTGAYEPMPADCLFCHQADYVQAPGHVASNFPQTCESCHRVTTWGDADFPHDSFPLTAGHGGLDCVACHTTGIYATIPADCASCHLGDYQQAPGHVTGNFPQTCEQCHGTTTWLDATFEHGFFPLTGGHGGLDCVACHTTGVYAAIPADCVSCHRTDYQQAPGHVTSSFPETCEQCHNTSTWLDATFEHGFFPLTGGHGGLLCLTCHTTGTYGPIPADCVSCHLSDYQLAPGHVTNSFPQTCEECHTTASWLDATFDHRFFPLTGGHGGLTCSRCHTGGSFGPIPADCYSCHATDYAGAPDHATLQLSTDCQSCHTINDWLGLVFVHSWPLVGPHRSPSERECSECHIGGTTATFSCEGSCHKHTVPKMIEKHLNVPDYVWDFPACVACHANGRAR